MSALSVEELFRYIVECAGQSENGHVSPRDSLDITFADLGYDSLALIEAAARIKQKTGRSVDDDLLAGVETPRELLDLLNDTVAEHG